MATYYISQQRNDGTHDGTLLHPFVTIAQAVPVVAAGDTVYIGSGTYRETVLLATAGGAATIIHWKGDPFSRYVLGDLPGIVRVTGAAVTTEIPGSAVVWNFNSKAYNQIWNLYLDGVSGANYCVSGAATSFINDCVVTGCSMAVIGANANRCFATGKNGFVNSPAVNSCIAIAESLAFNGTTTVLNSLAIGSGTGGFYGTGTTRNCIAFCCTNGFRGNSGTGFTITPTYCLAAYCATGYYGNGTNVPPDYRMVLTGNFAVGNTADTRGGSTYDVGSLTAAGIISIDLFRVARGLQPWVAAALKDLGNTTDATDILGRTRAGTADIGPWDLDQLAQGWGLPIGGLD